MNASDLLSMDSLWESARSQKKKTGGYAQALQAAKRTAAATFQSQLYALRSQTQTAPARPATQPSSPAAPACTQSHSENWIFAKGICGNRLELQEVIVSYTDDSTPEDPIAHVCGTADSGPYSFTFHIHDIDPTNASYAELAALFAHLQKNGAYTVTPGSAGSSVAPLGLEPGDVTKKQNFIHRIREQSTSWHFGPSIHTNARDLLRLYTGFMQARSSAGTKSAV